MMAADQVNYSEQNKQEEIQRIGERINQSKEKPLDKNQSIDIYLWEF